MTEQTVQPGGLLSNPVFLNAIVVLITAFGTLITALAGWIAVKVKGIEISATKNDVTTKQALAANFGATKDVHSVLINGNKANTLKANAIALRTAATLDKSPEAELAACAAEKALQEYTEEVIRAENLRRQQVEQELERYIFSELSR